MLAPTFGREGTILKRPGAHIPVSFGGLWERMRARGSVSMHRPAALPQVDVNGLDTYKDYLLSKMRGDPSIGRCQLCVFLASERKVHCGVKTMQKWLARQRDVAVV